MRIFDPFLNLGDHVMVEIINTKKVFPKKVGIWRYRNKPNHANRFFLIDDEQEYQHMPDFSNTIQEIRWYYINKESTPPSRRVSIPQFLYCGAGMLGYKIILVEDLQWRMWQ